MRKLLPKKFHSRNVNIALARRRCKGLRAEEVKYNNEQSCFTLLCGLSSKSEYEFCFTGWITCYRSPGLSVLVKQFFGQRLKLVKGMLLFYWTDQPDSRFRKTDLVMTNKEWASFMQEQELYCQLKYTRHLCHHIHHVL